MRDIVWYCIVSYCIGLYCTVLHCIVLYCSVLYCIVYCIAFFPAVKIQKARCDWQEGFTGLELCNVSGITITRYITIT
jgi:hypothetical protein